MLALVQFLVAVAAGAVSVFISVRLLRRAGFRIAWSLPRGRRFRAMVRRIFGYGAYSLLHSLGNKVVFSSDAIVVGIVVSVQAVTPYSIAGSLIQYLRTMLASTGKVFIPAVSEQHSRGRIAEVGRLFVGGSKLTVLMALPIASVLVILGQQFIRVWMGPEHMEAAGAILAVLGVTQVFSAPNYIAVGMLYGISRHSIIAWIRLGEAVANLTLSIILARWIGLIGVALGTAISHLIVVLVVVPRVVCPLVGMGAGRYLVQTYVRPIAAASPFIAATIWVSKNIELPNLPYFALVTILLTAMYIPCVYFLALDAAERQMVAAKLGSRARRVG